MADYKARIKTDAWKKGDRFYIEGDIEFDDYNVRVATHGTVLMDEVNGETQLLCCLDSIDGDDNVNVYVDITDMKRR